MNCPCAGVLADCPLCAGTGKPNCQTCGGTQLVMYEDELNHWDWQACPKCGQSVAGEKTLPVRIPKGATNWTLDNVSREYPELVSAADIIRTIIKEGHGWVILHSEPGKGKSFLAIAAVQEAVKMGLSAQYYETTSGMLLELQEAELGQHEWGYNALRRYLVGLDVLALDEFGKHRDTIFRLEKISEILGPRSDIGGWPVTIIATNETVSDIASRFPWLASRLSMPEEVFECDLSTVPDLREVGVAD